MMIELKTAKEMAELSTQSAINQKEERMNDALQRIVDTIDLNARCGFRHVEIQTMIVDNADVYTSNNDNLLVVDVDTIDDIVRVLKQKGYVVNLIEDSCKVYILKLRECSVDSYILKIVW